MNTQAQDIARTAWMIPVSKILVSTIGWLFLPEAVVADIVSMGVPIAGTVNR